MFRFTIRDLLWLMVVVGVALAMGMAWQIDRNQMRAAYRAEWQRDRDEFWSLLDGANLAHQMSDADRRKLVEDIVGKLKGPIYPLRQLPDRK